MNFLRADHLTEHTHIAHGFFTRNGGVSEGLYASLNCGFGSGDKVECVTENRARVTRALAGMGSLLTGHQTHSARAHIVTRSWDSKDAPPADALVTKSHGLPIGVLTADCTPILFADAKAGVIAAAHAGWKGAIGGIIEATIHAMETQGASRERIHAAIGPCIGPKSYEVSPEFAYPFMAEDPGNARFLLPNPARPEKLLFNLPGFTRARLIAAGIADLRINTLARDTCLEEDTFFSYRRATLRKEPVYGRQVSAIMLK